MKHIILLVALLLVASGAFAQTNDALTFWLATANNSADTSSWYYVGPENAVAYTMQAYDSTNCYIEFQYAVDKAATKYTDVPRLTATRTVGEDTLANIANVAAPKKLVSNVLRNASGSVDKIKGAWYIRAIVTSPSDASKHAAVAADRRVKITLDRMRVLR